MPDPGSLDRFQTARLSAARVTAGDLDDLVALWSEPRVARWLGGVRPEADVAAFLLWNLDHWDREGFGLWVLREHPDAAPVGYTALWRRVVGGAIEVELAYALQSDAWGRGIATEAGRAAITIAFDRLALPSVVAYALPANHASLAVMGRLGMAYEREVEHAGAPHALYRVTATGRRGTRDAQAQRASRTADSRSEGTSTST